MFKTIFPKHSKSLLHISLILLVGSFTGCLGGENTAPSTAIPAAPPIEIATATAVNEQGDGFPTPENTGEPPAEQDENSEGEVEGEVKEESTVAVEKAEPTLTLSTTVELPTPTAQPISVPPTQRLDENNLPPTNQDLAYISAGNLMLWTHQNHQIVPLFVPEVDGERFPVGTFAEVALVDFSADGNRAAVAVRYDLPPENGAGGDGSGDSDSDTEVEEIGTSEFDILYIDVVSKESWGLVRSIKNEINELAISPNQAYVAFTTVIDDGRNENAALGEFKELDGKLFRIHTPAAISPSESIQVTDCTGNCRNITWRQDSDLYFFSDQEGVYIANARASSAELILENRLKGQYLPLAWSPNDRAILMLDWPGEGGATYTVFDLPTQKLIAVPSTIETTAVQLPNTIWLADSRIISAFAMLHSNRESDAVFLATYRVDFDQANIGLDEQVELAGVQMLGNLKQLPDGRFVYNAPHLTDPNQAGLYRLTSFSEGTERLSGMALSGDTPETIWAMDGSTAVIQSQTSYVAAADGNLYQFDQMLKQPKWLPTSNAQR